MERRIAPRKLTETRVVVHHAAFDSTPLKTKNMSQSGVFVETTSPVQLDSGTQFEMTFMIDLDGVTRLRKVAATVIQVSPHGLGLRFR